jgi:rhodanese-related sulfurtransferase
MSPPLAGSMNMRFIQFLGLDFVGAFFYIGTYFSAGFLFSGALDRITAGYHAAAHVMGWVLIGLAAGYAGVQVWSWNKSRASRSVATVSPAEAARALSAGTAAIFDVRSHGYYDRSAMRVKGSRRMDPNAFARWAQEMPRDQPVYLYCTCIRDATSAQVAKLLSEKGIRGAVITGGLRAWKKAGLPLEPVPQEDMAALPLFK